MRFDGQRLKELRKARKWDQHRLAETARAHGTGITQSQISRYENGQEPSGRNAVALASALNVDITEFYVGSSEDDEEDHQPVFADVGEQLLHLVRSIATQAAIEAVSA